MPGIKFSDDSVRIDEIIDYLKQKEGEE